MEEVLGDLIAEDDKTCQIYLDDVLVASKTIEEHFQRLRKVFGKFREAGLKLSPKKCHLFRSKVKYLGHIVSEHGVETDPDKVDRIRNWLVPTNANELRTFLGFAGYYRRFVKDFSKISKPLSLLLIGVNTKRKKGKSNHNQ